VSAPLWPASCFQTAAQTARHPSTTSTVILLTPGAAGGTKKAWNHEFVPLLVSPLSRPCETVAQIVRAGSLRGVCGSWTQSPASRSGALHRDREPPFTGLQVSPPLLLRVGALPNPNGAAGPQSVMRPAQLGVPPAGAARGRTRLGRSPCGHRPVHGCSSRVKRSLDTAPGCGAGSRLGRGSRKGLQGGSESAPPAACHQPSLHRGLLPVGPPAPFVFRPSGVDVGGGRPQASRFDRCSTGGGL